MPAFPKPAFTYNFSVKDQIDLLLAHKEKRHIPAKSKTKLLIASWNIANLGLHKRWTIHAALIAEIIDWFDLIAIQEVNVNLEGLRQIEAALPSHYNVLFSDKAGNNERFAYIFDSRVVKQLEMVGEVAIPPKDHKYIKLPGVTSSFTGFDRNPYLGSFQWRNTNFVLLNVHSYFGSNSKKNIHRRALETYAIARHTDLMGNSKYAFSDKIIALGDFNLPLVEPGDLIYKALVKRGLELPKHSTKVYSNIADDKMYDQIAFLPSLKNTIQANGTFDFDNAVFPDLWQESHSKFKSYVKYYLSDHRPIWMQIAF